MTTPPDLAICLEGIFVLFSEILRKPLLFDIQLADGAKIIVAIKKGPCYYNRKKNYGRNRNERKNDGLREGPF